VSNPAYRFPTRGEAEKLETYELDEVEGFYKMEVPDFCRMPTENKKIQTEQQVWFAKSNKEDLLVLKKEAEAFEEYKKRVEIDIKKSTIALCKKNRKRNNNNY